MGSKISLVEFQKKPEEAYQPTMPTPEQLENLLLGKKLKNVVCLFTNEDGALTHYMDNLTTYEAIGMMEEVKMGLIMGATADIDLEDE